MIAVIDYGAGNIHSVSNALNRLGAETVIAAGPESLDQASKMILPGVGAFGKAVEALESRHFFSPIKENISRGKPFLGICLGFQLLFEKSEEAPGYKGLEIFKGQSVRLSGPVKIPQLGWNQVKQAAAHPLWANIPDMSFFYFAHSFIVKTEEDCVIGMTDYQGDFVSAAGRKNVTGLQFHPEKSQKAGLRILKNFLNM